MTEDLVAFLRARLDEDAKLAVSAETWSAQEEAQGTRRVDVDHSFERVVACTRSWRGLHIARHDPARVLAEVEAKRELLSRYKAMEADVLVLTGVEAILSEYRRVILPLLALPYADHPDYREDWRP